MGNGPSLVRWNSSSPIDRVVSQSTWSVARISSMRRRDSAMLCVARTMPVVSDAVTTIMSARRCYSRCGVCSPSSSSSVYWRGVGIPALARRIPDNSHCRRPPSICCGGNRLGDTWTRTDCVLALDGEVWRSLGAGGAACVSGCLHQLSCRSVVGAISSSACRMLSSEYRLVVAQSVDFEVTWWWEQVRWSAA